MIDHWPVTVLFALSLLLAWKMQTPWSKWIALGAYAFLILWIASQGYLFRMSLEELIRLWTSSEVLTQTYQPGFYLNILLGILLAVKHLRKTDQD